MKTSVTANVTPNNEAVVSFRSVDGGATIIITPSADDYTGSSTRTLTIVVTTNGFSGGPENVVTKLIVEL